MAQFPIDPGALYDLSLPKRQDHLALLANHRARQARTNEAAARIDMLRRRRETNQSPAEKVIRPLASVAPPAAVIDTPPTNLTRGMSCPNPADRDRGHRLERGSMASLSGSLSGEAVYASSSNPSKPLVICHPSPLLPLSLPCNNPSPKLLEMYS